MDKSHAHRAVEKERGTLWLVWLVPLAAMLMAGWLIYQHYLDKGVEIVVTFESGKGLEAGKTPLIYQGIKIGTVSKVRIDDNDLYKVRAIITVDPKAAPYVTRKGTKFIKVEPKVSLTEITGLDTILTGVYIDLYPAGRSKKEILSKPERYHFKGMEHYPPKRYEKGLYITLKAEEAGVSLNAPVLYKGFIVGKVVDKHLKNRRLYYTAFIEDRYRSLVNSSTKFWKIDGVDLRASLAGVKVKMDSLATLMAGGIGFETPDFNATAKPKESYTLFPSKLDTDLSSDTVTLIADKAYNIDPAFSSVIYKGFKVGKIVSLRYDPDACKTIFQIRFSKPFAHLANEKAWFWIVRPVIGIRQIKGLDAVVSGPYIAVDTHTLSAPPKHRFQLHEDPMPVKGETIHLSAVHAESLKEGTAIFYKDIPIGQINKIALLPGKKSLDVTAVIYDKFRKFLNDSSMFYVKSGVEVEADLTDIHINSGSLETLVVGGVSMVTLRQNAPRTKKRFFLYKDYKTFKKARYLKSGGARYHVVMKALGSLSKGSPVLYKKMKAGEVIGYRYLPKKDAVDVMIFVQKEFKQRINLSTRFENVSGVELKVNFPDLTLKADSLKSIIAGGLRFSTPDPKAKPAKEGHTFTLYTPQTEEKERYATFEVWSPERHDIHEGTPLLYKGFAVGKVKRVTLANNIIRFDMLIQKAYARLLRPDSKIWLKTFQANLEGVKNSDTLLKGPALVITPGRAEGKEHSYLLSPPPAPTYGKPGLRVTLQGDRLSSLSPGAPVYYRQVPIGAVESYRLSDDGQYVLINIYIQPRYAHLVRQKSHFFIAGALGMDVGLTGIKIKTETLETLIRGGIGLAVPQNPGPVAEEGTLFRLYNEPKKKWLAWRPSL